LGIGATSAVFSILEAVLLRPLPYQHPDRLVAIWDGHVREASLAKVFSSYEDFEIWKAHSTSFEELAAVTWATGDRILRVRGRTRTALAIPASVDFFRLLGVSPLLGRTFQPEDRTRGCAVVLAHRFWEQNLGADANIVDQGVTLDERSCVVVGVMPPGFEFYPAAADMWSLITPGADTTRLNVGVFGRLKGGVTREAAQAELTALHRPTGGSGDEHRRMFVPTVYELQSEFTWLAGRNLRSTLLALFAAVGVVLLIACVNTANVLLTRATARRREFAIRAALGSGRWRVIRQLLTEGLVLSSAGAAFGVLLATAGVLWFRAINPIELPPGAIVGVDIRVLAFAALLAVLTAVVFALAPAWSAARVDIVSLIKGAGHEGSGHRRPTRLRAAMVTVQIACSFVLLVGAGLLIDSVGRLGAAPLGFDPARLMMTNVRLPRSGYTDIGRRVRFYDQLTYAVRAIPQTAGVAICTSLLRGRSTNFLAVEGRPSPSADSAVPDVGQDQTSERYFQVMRVPVLAGRPFDGRDREGLQPVAIVNDALVRRYFPNENPIGQRVRYGNDARAPWLTIVGVVGNQKTMNLYREMTWADAPMLYLPVSQNAPSEVVLVVRAAGEAANLGTAVQKVLTSLDPGIPLGELRSVAGDVSKTLAYPRFRALLAAAFAGLALVLALVGLYGVLAQVVAQRTREIGIRIALGARRESVLTLILSQGMWLVGTGLTFGLVAATWIRLLLATMLYDARNGDLRLLALVFFSFCASAFVAIYVPARRATRVNPVDALRNE